MKVWKCQLWALHMQNNFPILLARFIQLNELSKCALVNSTVINITHQKIYAYSKPCMFHGVRWTLDPSPLLSWPLLHVWRRLTHITCLSPTPCFRKHFAKCSALIGYSHCIDSSTCWYAFGIMNTFLWQGLGAHKSCLGPEMPGRTEQVKTVIICHSYHRQLMYTALYNSLSFYQWKYSCQKKRKRKPKKWCGRFPHLILIQYLRRRQTSPVCPGKTLLLSPDELFLRQICT